MNNKKNHSDDNTWNIQVARFLNGPVLPLERIFVINEYLVYTSVFSLCIRIICYFVLRYILHAKLFNYSYIAMHVYICLAWENSRHFTLAPLAKETSEQWAKKFHTDDVATTEIRVVALCTKLFHQIMHCIDSLEMSVWRCRNEHLLNSVSNAFRSLITFARFQISLPCKRGLEVIIYSQL